MSKRIDLPFAPDMKKAVLEGRKCCTSRGEKKGEAGDWFELDGRKFEIFGLLHTALGNVAQLLFKSEGFASPEAFIARWKQLHRGHYDPDKLVWVHWFAEKKEAGK